ncbi:single-stranded-DNA-specific exonuclease RecJ [Caproicibacter fermentans]|uniref:Single-stranded-DNA-specific exonuclease RecJ n=1 Tax=Caproicibacter fermentans TaxID=2576756 RepID=A0A7G8TBD4_9FIRM|nr:single-stranded-DNA-specific exonuclease RecJ [Caproicibacter fermentans]
MSVKKWRIRRCDESAASQIAEEMKIPRSVAALLAARGMTDEFRKPSGVSFSDPFLLPDMEKAAERITSALDGFEKIAVYGDYDADGVTATAMLYSYLESCGGNVIYYIPEREGEGYGLNMGAVDTLHEQGVDLIVTVDNGISSVDEIAYANSLGIDTVVTDHHHPREVLPPACAVVDACRADSGAPYHDFAGVGVAFKLIQALEGPDGDLESLLENYGDLIAIGTIGDIVPLTGENRALVSTGLSYLPRTDRPGLRALLEQTGLENRELSAGQVAFILVPRINAAGRMESPDQAVRLLISESQEEAAFLAGKISEDNNYRRDVENEILEKVEECFRREPALLYDRVLVVDGEDWHHGVIGIVAARIVDRFGKPCIVISRSKNEARGSGRSVEGFSLFDAVYSCRDLLTRFGGHPMAAGLSLPPGQIGEFRARINAFAAGLGQPMPAPVLSIDCLLTPRELSLEITQAMRYLEPFGTGNPEPVFGLKGVTITDITPVGGGKHLRVSVSGDSRTVRCMRFRTTLEEFSYRCGDRVDLAVTLQEREYAGRTLLSIVIRDMKLSGMDMDGVILGQSLYDQFRRGEPLSSEEAARMKPKREEFASIYRALRGENGYSGTPELLLPRIPGSAPGMEKLLTALDVFAERGLIRLERDADTYRVKLIPQNGKINLKDSEIIRSLELFEKAGEQDGMAAEDL